MTSGISSHFAFTVNITYYVKTKGRAWFHSEITNPAQGRLASLQMYVDQKASPLCFAFFFATVIASLIFCVTSSAKSLDCSSPYCQVRVRFQVRL